MGRRKQPRVSLGIAAFTDWHVGLRDEYDALGRVRRRAQPLSAYRDCCVNRASPFPPIRSHVS